MDRLRRGIVVDVFEGPAPVCAIVVAAGLSFVMPMVFPVCPGIIFFGLATSLGFDIDSSRGFSGKLRLVAVESATALLTRGG